MPMQLAGACLMVPANQSKPKRVWTCKAWTWWACVLQQLERAAVQKGRRSEGGQHAAVLRNSILIQGKANESMHTPGWVLTRVGRGSARHVFQPDVRGGELTHLWRNHGIWLAGDANMHSKSSRSQDSKIYMLYMAGRTRYLSFGKVHRQP